MAPPINKKKKHFSTEHRLISATDTNQQKPLGSFVTFGKRRSLRVAMKIKKRILRKIWICSDIWMDTLPFFDRPQLGLKLALLSPRFDVLVDKHFDGKSELPIWRAIRICKDNAGPKAQLSVWIDGKSMQFPLTDRSLPNKICFCNLWIMYVDHSVIAFLRANQKIFDKGTNLDLYMNGNNGIVQPVWNVFARDIWSIFAPNIRHLTLPNEHLDNLRRHISPTILTDLNQLKSITSVFLLPDVIGADFDGPNATVGQALSKWLHTPTKDGQPKRLYCRNYEHASLNSGTTGWVNNFKKAFLRATTPSVSYVIRLELSYKSTRIEPFELMNERTNEMLILEKEGGRGIANDDCLLKRCQIGRTVQWEDKKTKKLNNVYFMLNEKCISHCLHQKRAK